MNDSIKRILVLHSFRDEGFNLRLQQVANNPYLEEFQFEHISIIDNTRASVLIPEYYRQQAEKTGPLNSCIDINDDEVHPSFFRQLEASIDLSDILLQIINEEVEPLLHRKIETLDPDIVILHGGTIFNEAQEAFIALITRLMSKYPKLRGRFVLEGKERCIKEWSKKSFFRRTGLAYERLLKAFNYRGNQPSSVLEWIAKNFVSNQEIDDIVKAIFG